MKTPRLRQLVLAAAVLAPLHGCVSEDSPGTTIRDGHDLGGTPDGSPGTCQTPLAQVRIVSGGEPGSCSVVRFTYELDPTTSRGFECSLDAGPFLPCPPDGVTYAGLGDGQHRFRVRALFAVGQTSGIAEREFVVDATPPALQILSPTPSSRSGQLTLKLGGVEAGTTIVCVLDGTVLPGCCNDLELPELAVGDHVLRVKASDRCENSVDATVEWTVVGDAEACGPMPGMCDWVPPGAPGCGTTVCGTFDPCECVDGKWRPYPLDCFCPQLQVQITSGAEDGVGCASTTFTYAVVAGTAFAYFRCSLDGTPLPYCPVEGITFDGLAAGPHLFSVDAVQNGGLSSPTVQRAFTVDTAPPAVAITAPAPGSTSGASVTLRLTSDAGAALTCRLDGTVLAECRDGLTLPSLARGQHRLDVVAADSCDNQATASVTWTVR